MNMTKVVLISFLLTLAIYMGTQRVVAQSPVAIWIHASDEYFPSDSITMWFGNHKNATYEKMDTLTFPDLGFIREGHPDVPKLSSYGSFSCVWYSIPGRVNLWDEGLWYYDFRPFPMNESRKDTFRIKFHGDSSSSDIIFRWPDTEYLANVCDSMKCKVSGSEPIDMFPTDSLIIPDAGDNGIIYLIIYKWGKVTTGIETGNTLLPADIKLFQNYPNPFNPVTQINYTVAKAGRVSLKVYNILGEEVRIIVDDYQIAGEKSVVFDAHGLPGSVYFYRLTTADAIEIKKMTLIK